MGTLRVIAGTAKGRRLMSVPGKMTRPITDRVKEALFNILSDEIYEADFLDLFAGTGSVGIEAMSRGARFTRFVDASPQAIATIRHNLERTGFSSQAQVIRKDVFRFLKTLPDQEFDYIYVAPPQYQELWEKTLICLDDNPTWLKPSGMIIVQIHPREYHPFTLRCFEESSQRKYGSTMLIFYKWKEKTNLQGAQT